MSEDCVPSSCPSIHERHARKSIKADAKLSTYLHGKYPRQPICSLRCLTVSALSFPEDGRFDDPQEGNKGDCNVGKNLLPAIPCTLRTQSGRYSTPPFVPSLLDNGPKRNVLEKNQIDDDFQGRPILSYRKGRLRCFDMHDKVPRKSSAKFFSAPCMMDITVQLHKKEHSKAGLKVARLLTMPKDAKLLNGSDTSVSSAVTALLKDFETPLKSVDRGCDTISHVDMTEKHSLDCSDQSHARTVLSYTGASQDPLTDIVGCGRVCHSFGDYSSTSSSRGLCKSEMEPAVPRPRRQEILRHGKLSIRSYSVLHREAHKDALSFVVERYSIKTAEDNEEVPS
ncbi:hypothetical protein ERJ75_001762800 [Trypanosoma vivax]|uniref:Uncharacterized protein n=1 Tax=Trypanosoma vivax (strain Y486) TaxID=1055687 RepID=G0TRE9_TRYVY|nr:hypothetical protein TRVL_04520 [Trypanosoma vivax]KAH8603956.1 hypothetical protein ERJ75_001762800 [Trypanosoma vivax]CCC46513.1 conserved hypothetical protein, in T. vivax [Trypanosoma vivax Y486]